MKGGLRQIASWSIVRALVKLWLSLISLVGRVWSNLKYRALVKNCSNSICHYTTEIKFGENVSVGENTRIGPKCTLGAMGGIEIGKNVIISKNVTLETASLNLMKGTPFKENIAKKIVIGDNVWIGANSTILSGVRIGDYSIIGAGSVITKNVEAKTIVTSSRAIEKFEIKFLK